MNWTNENPSSEWLTDNRAIIEAMFKLHDDTKVVADEEES